jgi:hypothetical protein
MSTNACLPQDHVVRIWSCRPGSSSLLDMYRGLHNIFSMFLGKVIPTVRQCIALWEGGMRSFVADARRWYVPRYPLRRRKLEVKDLNALKITLNLCNHYQIKILKFLGISLSNTIILLFFSGKLK